MRLPALVSLWLVSCPLLAASQYLTWIDSLGRVHNTFIDERFTEQQRQAQRQVQLSDQARLPAAGTWPGSTPAAAESKRRYFTWVDGSGQLRNSFHLGDTTRDDGGRDRLLGSGERARDYIDSQVLEGKGFSRSESESSYFTWVDEQGRVRNSSLAPKGPAVQAGAAESVRYTEGRQVSFERAAVALPLLDGQPTAALQALLEGTEAPATDALYQMLLQRCCGQMRDSEFAELSADEPRFEELSRFSPKFDFPMGRSYYTGVRLPAARQAYGLRVRSFANQQVVYPSLLFLDESKRPTRLVSDAVYQLHPETWHRYAYLEGTVQVKAEQGERYVLLLTTEEDRSLQTLDNRPYKRPLQALALDESGMQRHAHAQEGSFELAIVR